MTNLSESAPINLDKLKDSHKYYSIEVNNIFKSVFFWRLTDYLLGRKPNTLLRTDFVANCEAIYKNVSERCDKKPYGEMFNKMFGMNPYPEFNELMQSSDMQEILDAWYEAYEYTDYDPDLRH